MYRKLLFITVLCYNYNVAVSKTKNSANDIQPSYKPTSGEVWPKVKQQIREDFFYVYPGNQFVAIETPEYDCKLLQKAVERFRSKLNILNGQVQPHRNKRSVNNKGNITKFVLNLAKPCESKPHLDMDEYYEITVQKIVTVFSKSVWGIIRGLESLTHMFYRNDTMLVIDGNKIKDYPNFKHRGLMLDTARHYISPKKIMEVLDSMAMNKMNVFHWHIVDDESFPYQSKIFPELSDKGAFSKKEIYNTSIIHEITEYATIRGIRVIPEFNMPGHSRSLAKSHPEVITQCYKNGKATRLGPMRPFVKDIYNFLSDLLYEISNRFSDSFIHLGGNDVDVGCWKSNPKIEEDLEDVIKFFRAKIAYSDVIVFFMAVVSIIMREVQRADAQVIVWQDAIEAIRTPSILNVFKDNKMLHVHMYKNPVPKKYKNAYKVIYSVPWDLSDIDNTFSMMYAAQPPSWRTDKTIGGEALVWSQSIYDANLMTSIWMRASAVAEVLWNYEPAESPSDIPSSVYERLEEHTSRMKSLGVDVEKVNHE